MRQPCRWVRTKTAKATQFAEGMGLGQVLPVHGRCTMLLPAKPKTMRIATHVQVWSEALLLPLHVLLSRVTQLATLLGWPSY